jgi:sugar lactone lactonase YvrE
MGGRVLELFADGRAPRVIARDVMFPNALAFGPDDHLYFPLVVTGQIGRVPVGGGEVEIFAAGLNVPTAVKFDAAGRLVTVQSGSGEVTRFDLQTRQATSLGRVRIGIDNLEFSAAGDLYLSNFADGGISQLQAGGAEQVLVEPGLVGPAGLAAAADGTIYAADGMSYAVVSPDGTVGRPTNLLIHGFPGYVRGVAVGPDGALFFANSAGGVARFAPGRPAEFLASDLDQLMGLAVAPDGSLIACEAGAGRLLAIGAGGNVRVLKDGLRRPSGLALAQGKGQDGSYYVAEAAAGRVVQVRNGATSTVLDGLAEPHGVAVAHGQLFVLDRVSRLLHAVDLASGRAQIVARQLPVGPAPGIVPKVLPGIAGIMPGPLLPFADLAAAPDGSVLIGAEGDGSLLRLRSQ